MSHLENLSHTMRAVQSYDAEIHSFGFVIVWENSQRDLRRAEH